MQETHMRKFSQQQSRPLFHSPTQQRAGGWRGTSSRSIHPAPILFVCRSVMIQPGIIPSIALTIYTRALLFHSRRVQPGNAGCNNENRTRSECCTREKLNEKAHAAYNIFCRPRKGLGVSGFACMPALSLSGVL